MPIYMEDMPASWPRVGMSIVKIRSVKGEMVERIPCNSRGKDDRPDSQGNLCLSQYIKGADACWLWRNDPHNGGEGSMWEYA